MGMWDQLHDSKWFMVRILYLTIKERRTTHQREAEVHKGEKKGRGKNLENDDMIDKQIVSSLIW